MVPGLVAALVAYLPTHTLQGLISHTPSSDFEEGGRLGPLGHVPG